ncbi:MAG: hypothetical protein JOZ17_12495 [Acetobacteraceae bacterium]|nr:hypothetical protein [Acetobacteraceae bacterium]
MYRCEATSVEGFVQQLAVSYLGNGYWFYVVGEIPEGKDPRRVDEKLVTRYQIDLSKWARARRKRAGLANLQYLRYGRLFVLLATHGAHAFFEEEASSIRDARKTPIRFRGYSISYRNGHPHVRIEQEEYKRLKAYFLELALHRSAERLGSELARLPFEPYAPVRVQLLAVLRSINRERRRAGFEPVPNTCFRFVRRVCQPFGPVALVETTATTSESDDGISDC